MPAVDVDPDPGVVEVHLAVGATTVEYFDGVETPVLAYRDLENPNDTGRVPGPMIVAELGDTVVVTLRNDMPVERTTLHMHGIRLGAEMDGNPVVSGLIDPGETFEYRFVARDAGFYWYHPHVNTPDHLDLGLQGPIVIRDRTEPVSRERWFVLDDISLDDSGAVVLREPGSHQIRPGDTLLVNGRPGGIIQAAAGSSERWHLVNSANVRHLTLRVQDSELAVIGGDGGLLATPYAVDSLTIAPGERLDVLIDLPSRTSRTVLDVQSLPTDHGRDVGATPAETMFRVRLESAETGESTSPSAEDYKHPVTRLELDEDTNRQEFTLRTDVDRPGGPLMYINEQAWPFNEPVRVRFGDVEIWHIENMDGTPHPFHLHGMFFQVIARNGKPENILAWKDTVPIEPYGSIVLAVQYDALGHWLFHCQIPEHAHMGMTGDLFVDPQDPSF